MDTPPDSQSMYQVADAISSLSACGTMDNVYSSPLLSSNLKEETLLSCVSSKMAGAISSSFSQATSSVSTCSTGEPDTPSSSREQPTIKKSRNAPKSAIPRPPNAWILYRSIKVKEKSIALEVDLPQVPLSTLCDQPTPSTFTSGTVASQSVLSRKVADLWKAESKQVKDYYFELAKKKKEEHAIMYPNYKFTPAQRRNKNSSIDVKNEESTTGDLYQGIKPVKVVSSTSTAKTKAKGLPSLYIDVNAAEQSAPFQTVFSAPINEMLPKGELNTLFQPGVPDVGSSTFDFSALVEGKTAMEFMLQQDLFSQECATTSRLPKDTSNPWTMSPLPMTPADETTVNSKADSALTPWTTWIMDQPMNVDPATPLNTEQPANAVAPLTDPPASAKRKRVGKHIDKALTAGLSTSTIKSGKKTVSSTGIRQTRSMSKVATSSSPLKKLKKALICTEPDKIAKASAKGKVNTSSEMGTESIKEVISVEKMDIKAQEGSKSEQALSMLLQSYDCEGADSDVEEALLCADSLIESFASMAAWSPDQAWFSGLIEKKEPDSAAVQDVASFEPSSWNLYSQLFSGDQPSISQPQVQLSGESLTENYLAECLQSELPLTDYGPILNQALFSSSKTTIPDQSEDNIATAPIKPLQWGMNLDDPMESEGDTGWDLHQQDWNNVLDQCTLELADDTQPVSSPIPQLVQPLVDTSSESMWNLIYLDNIPQPQGDVSDNDVGKGEEKVKSPSPMQIPITSTKDDVPMIELHGSFTEEQLLQKLEKIRRVS